MYKMDGFNKLAGHTTNDTENGNSKIYLHSYNLKVLDMLTKGRPDFL